LKNRSTKLGQVIRTNSEVIAGVKARDKRHDFSKGICITSRRGG
jgi:hypothetical protein